MINFPNFRHRVDSTTTTVSRHLELHIGTFKINSLPSSGFFERATSVVHALAVWRYSGVFNDVPKKPL